MPPERHQPTQKRRRLPFKPPSRASTSTAGPSTTSSTKPKPAPKKTTKTNAAASSSKSTISASTSRASKTSKPSSSRRKTNTPSPSGSATSESESGSASDSGSASRAASLSDGKEPDYILAEITHRDAAEDVVSSEPLVPQKLLTRLVHHHFRNEKTKIAKDANAAVAKYIDVYVREAVARAAYERAEAGGSGGIADGFLEVEDLEKMGPQLAMDF